MKPKRTSVGIRCPACGDVIFSEHVHDMKWCKCGKVAIYGGDAYQRILHDPSIDPKTIEEVKREAP